jgi:hypothetical protein
MIQAFDGEANLQFLDPLFLAKLSIEGDQSKVEVLLAVPEKQHVLK